MRIPHAETETVVGAVAERTLEHHPGIHRKIDQVAVVLGGAHDAGEQADRAVRVGAVHPDHLVGDSIHREVPLVLQGLAVTGRIGQRDAVAIQALVGEILAVVPHAEAVGPAQGRRCTRLDQRTQCRERKLHFRDRQIAFAAQRETGAVVVLRLRVAAALLDRAAVVHAGQDLRAVDRARRQPDAERRERVSRTAGGHVGRWQHGPAEHGVDEHQRIGRDHELLVHALLADLDVHTVFIEEFLVVPEFPEPRRTVRLDAAGGLQRLQILAADAVAVDVQDAHVEQTAVMPERAVGVDLQHHLRQAVVDEALLCAARDVAQRFAGFLQGQRDAVLAQVGAQAPHVAQQVAAAVDAVEKTEWPA